MTWRDRLLDWAMRLVTDVEESLRTPGQDAAIARVIPEQANLRLAMDWAREVGEDVAALRIASAVPLSPISERRQLISDLLARVGNTNTLQDDVAARAWAALANIAFEQSDWKFGIDAAQRSAHSFERAGLSGHQAWERFQQALLQWGEGDVVAVDDVLEPLAARFRALNDDVGLGYTFWISSLRASDLDRASLMACEADLLLRRAGSTVGIAHNVEGRAIIAHDQGDLESARRYAADAVKLFSGSLNYGCTAHALEVAAVVLTVQDEEAHVTEEIISAAQMLREESGQGHRPWEIRARHSGIENVSVTSVSASTATGRQHTLASAAALAIRTLERN